MDMFLSTTHEDIAEVRGTTGAPLSQAQRQRINVIRDFLLQQQDLCAEGRGHHYYSMQSTPTDRHGPDHPHATAAILGINLIQLLTRGRMSLAAGAA